MNLPRCAALALALLCGAVRGEPPPIVLGFDDLVTAVADKAWGLPLPRTYGGLVWTGGDAAVANSEAAELTFPFAASSGSQSLFSGGHASEIRISPQRGRFDFLGARFRTWGEATTATVSFSGWAGGTKLHQAGPFVIDRTFRPIHLEWPDLDHLTIQGSGIYLMDDFRYRPAPGEKQPEEATRRAGQGE